MRVPSLDAEEDKIDYESELAESVKPKGGYGGFSALGGGDDSDDAEDAA